MIRNIPEGWRVEKLGNISSIIGGGTPRRNNSEYWENGNILWLSPTDLGKIGEIIEISNSTDKITLLGLNKSSAKILPIGTVLYSSRATIGKIAINTIEVSTNQGFTNFICNENILNKYLAVCLNRYRQEITLLSNSTTFKEISKSSFKKFKIPIPPLPQQEKIVKVLDITSALIEKQKELIDKYDLFLKSKFIEMFGDPIKNPMGWEIKKLNQFTTLVSSGSTPKGGQSSYLESGEIRFIRSQNVRMNKMDYNGIYYISEEVYTKMKRSQVQYNDVLLNITGASIGRIAIYKDKTRANVNQHVCIIRLIEELNNKYLSFMISSDSFQNQIISNQSGATREALNYSQIKKFNIPYPPINLQNKFAKIVEKIETIKQKETKKLKELETLHSSLIDKAFKGEIK